MSFSQPLNFKVSPTIFFINYQNCVVKILLNDPETGTMEIFIFDSTSLNGEEADLAKAYHFNLLRRKSYTMEQLNWSQMSYELQMSGK